ncbi:GmrSD restriction endonuclease domain-containing protein [Streptomyces sp. NPDC003444]
MPPTLYRDTGYTLRHLIENIEGGRIGLPDIQRPFVWSAAKTRDLFDSMYRGYPIGTLMFWETGAEVGTRQIGTEASDRTPQLLVVDGQQRLTALFAVLTGRKIVTKSFDEINVRIAFHPEDQTFEVTDAAIERNAHFIPDITALWTQGGYKSTVRQFFQRLEQAGGQPLSDAAKDELEERIDRVRDLHEFRFQVVELGASADEEQVADIFVRINSEGVKLNQSDFILTLMSVHWEKGRRQLEDFSRDAVIAGLPGPSPRNAFLDPSPDQLLRVAVAVAFRRARLQHVYSVLRGKDLETGKITADRRQEQFDRLAQAHTKVLDLTSWHEFFQCVAAAGFRSRKMITSDNALLYSYTIWLIGRHDFGLTADELRSVVGRWFFMAHTTGRYSNSPESQMEFDLGRIGSLPPGDGRSFIAELDRIIAANFTGDYWDISLPNRLDTSSSRSPVLFAYQAALNILDAEMLLGDQRIRALMDPSAKPAKTVDRDNLFHPKTLAKLGVTDRRQVNAIANMAYVAWPTGKQPNAEAPHEYWPRVTEAMAPEALKRQVRWHALPVGWEQLDYFTFLERRRQLIAKVVREAFETLTGKRPVYVPTAPADIIAAGESQGTEFKVSARWNVHTRQADKSLRHNIVKAVCGFLNGEGGNLYIGVADDGTVLGIDDDLATLESQASVDGYELFVRQLLDDSLSTPTATTVRVRFPEISGNVVCQISVAAAGRPVFAKPSKGGNSATDFWVRVGNATKQLHGDDLLRYQEEHWG